MLCSKFTYIFVLLKRSGGRLPVYIMKERKNYSILLQVIQMHEGLLSFSLVGGCMVVVTCKETSRSVTININDDPGRHAGLYYAMKLHESKIFPEIPVNW